MQIGTWRAPQSAGGSSEEQLVSFAAARPARVLVLPAWFDEANKLRRFTIEVMRRLDGAGIDSFLPDLPGCNESLSPLDRQTLADWRTAAGEASRQFDATHVLAIRAGALIAPPELPGWRYAPLSGAKQLRAMIRARTIAAREAGQEERSETLMDAGRSEGLALAGWQIGATMFRELESAEPEASEIQAEIAQATLGGPGLWLRAEPDDDAAQADALAAIIALALGDRR
ncbi:hypothetical protein [Erythrobacter sp. JK5]|uniref:hypothetical protein n=1 Tax=Erythrobacter sp. JK5 TaxID=2829500 RepID=UPI001BA93CAC|nr:hypothetical protein [Erythrobacter sp. JK5]QUL38592.1 hypothetical protein KDC96_04120 [Erythrobacter sp. JK5]